MARQRRYVALEFGVGRGEAAVGLFDGKTVAIDPIHAFPILSTGMLGVEYWDFPGMIINAKLGLRGYSAKYGSALDSVACSSWGVDFGLLDKTGQLLANPVHFMDKRTLGAREKLHAVIPERSLHLKTGAQSRRQNTLCQLFSLAKSGSPLLDKTATVLLMADLVSYFLTGTAVQEYTLATTTGMYDVENGDWSRDVVSATKIPAGAVPDIVAPGTVIGEIVDAAASECGLGMVPVIAPASHSIAGAVAAAPAAGDEWAYIVSGLWDQVGVEMPTPLVNDDTFAAGLANEGGVDGNFRLAKTVAGLVPLVGCLKAWERQEGREFAAEEVLVLAGAARPLTRFIDPNLPSLYDSADVPEAINAFLRETGQPLADTRGDFIRLCLESLVLSHRRAIAQLAAATGRRIRILHLLGYGAGHPLFCQMVADATRIPVRAGPARAKAIGNVLMQAMALGDIGSLSEAREISSRSFEAPLYEPRNGAEWDEAYGKFVKLI